MNRRSSHSERRDPPVEHPAVFPLQCTEFSITDLCGSFL
jgi:hypothetical protein